LVYYSSTITMMHGPTNIRLYMTYFKHYYRCSDIKYVIIIVYFLQILVDHLRMRLIISQCFPLVLMNQNNIVSAMDRH